ncbi:MAG: putative cysteine desulfurase [Acidimicrobiales bacterium]|nr:putative cysteine desulfurase [Acidimicrobiales bacterium]
MPAYLDHAASTPVRPEAAAAALPFLTDLHGNPTAAHAWGRQARRALDDARDDLAEVLGARPGEVVFTSGGTEADNQAIAGVLAARGGVAVCSAIEHHAVLEPVERSGGRVVRVDHRGTIDLDALRDALDPGVTVVSVMLANNEIGVLQRLDEVVEIVRIHAPGAVVHTDAVQAFPWIDVADAAAAADLVSVSAHKFGGLKGSGALVVRPGAAVAPILRGGGQERDRRSGTPNVVGAVAMAAAARATHDHRKATVERVSALRDRLADGLLAAVPDAVETAVAGGDRSRKVAGSLHLCVPGVESEALLFLLDQAGVAASAAASCASGALDPSHVLAALGCDRALAGGSLRLSLGWNTTAADVDLALQVVPAAVARLRAAGVPR